MPVYWQAKLAMTTIAIILSAALPSVRGESHNYASDQPSGGEGKLDEAEFLRYVDQLLDEQHAQPQTTSVVEASMFAIATDQSLGSVQPTFFQPQPALTPAPSAPQAPTSPGPAESIVVNQFGTFGVPRSLLVSDKLVVPASASLVSGLESQVRLTTDAGNLLDKSPASVQIGIQRRNPVVADPRVRGSRVGSLAASGSYWVPARIDLDTALSKLDSRIVDQIVVIPGPYTALQGPGMQFIDTDLKRSPRYGPRLQNEGMSLAEFNSNGDRWHLRQNYQGGDDRWGYRGGYGHREGSDYTTGSGAMVPSSYESRDAHFALGSQLFSRYNNVEFRYLRLDQRDIELPGQAFDIDTLSTDGYEVILDLGGCQWYDHFEVSTWYNTTRLEGSAQNAGKRATFPAYDDLAFEGFTDVESSSAGYSAAATWGNRAGNDPTLTVGTDLRHVAQELNELTSSTRSGGAIVNSPIPKSHQAMPGVYVEIENPSESDTRVRAGGRIDWASSDIDVDPADLEPLPNGFSVSEHLGSDEFDQDELLGLGFLAIDRSFSSDWTMGASIGYAERAPNLTERYAVFPFMFLIQSGLNTVTGDPELDKERRIQCDWRIGVNKGRLRTAVTFFHAWSFDHITYENFNLAPLGNGDNQVQLKYVNTALAVLRGVESRSEFDVTDQLTAFATLKYLEGEDRSRNGSFATAAANLIDGPSVQFPGLPRGTFGTPSTADTEPLPGILPLEARLGFRMEEAVDLPTKGFELSARLVASQDRVAASLLESPTPGFATGDLRGYWRPREGLLIAMGIENFTNTRYREHLDFRSLVNGIQIQQPGANFYLATEFNY